MTTLMAETTTHVKTRTPQEVFASHQEAIELLDLDKLMADYAEDAVMLTHQGSFHGREEILNGFFKAVLSQFPDVKITFEATYFEADMCIVHWSADSSAVTMPVGLGFLIIQDGLIQRQGEWFQMFPNEE